jgi:lipopolysaccharide export system protein LptA
VHQFTCTGTPTLTDAPRTITAQQLVVATTPRTAVFSGGVQVSSQPGTQPSNKLLKSEPLLIHSDLLTYHYGDRYAEFTGNIKMTITPRPRGSHGTAMKQAVNAAPSTMTCTLLNYDYNSGKAVANGNVVVTQKMRTIWADQADFYEENNTVVLAGNIRMKSAGDDQFKSMDNAEKIAVSLDDQHGWYTVDAKQGKKINLSVDVDAQK